MMMDDQVKGPAHYTMGGLEVITILKAKLSREEFYGFLFGTAMTYLFRHQLKGNPGLDLAKAKKYLEWMQEEQDRKAF